MTATNPPPHQDKRLPSSEEFTEEEEELFQTLANSKDSTTQIQLTKDQVRSIRRLFDKVDVKKTGFVDSGALEDKLLRIGDRRAHRVIKELVEAGVGNLTFVQFVGHLRMRLTTEEAVRLQDSELEYLDSMGIDSERREQQMEFGDRKQERLSMRKLSRAGSSGGGGGGSTGTRSSSAASSNNELNNSGRGGRTVVASLDAKNSEEVYLEEFGFGNREETKEM